MNNQRRVLPRSIAFISLCLVLIVVTIPACAQNTTGQITGQITDSTQAGIGGASIEAVQVSTGRSFSTTTDSKGLYVLPDLPIGRYRLTSAYAGFSKQVINNI